MLTGMLSVTSRGSATSDGRRRVNASTSTDQSTASPQAISIALVSCWLAATGET